MSFAVATLFRYKVWQVLSYDQGKISVYANNADIMSQKYFVPARLKYY